MTDKIKTHPREKLFGMLIIRKYVHSFTSEFTVMPLRNQNQDNWYKLAAKLKKITQWY